MLNMCCEMEATFKHDQIRFTLSTARSETETESESEERDWSKNSCKPNMNWNEAQASITSIAAKHIFHPTILLFTISMESPFKLLLILDGLVYLITRKPNG